MSDQTVKPALTPEEWVRIQDGHLVDENEAFLPSRDPMSSERHWLTDLQLAAALLNVAGPEYSPWLTWEDVDLLRDLLTADRLEEDPEGDAIDAAKDRLADRIAALLPPRETER